MEKKALTLSTVLHAVVLGLMMADISLPRAPQKAAPAVVMVDLSKLGISDKTNLPPDVKAPKKAPASPPKLPPKKEVPPKAAAAPKVAPPQTPPKPTPTPPKKEAAPVVPAEPPKPAKAPKPESPKKTPPKSTQKPTQKPAAKEKSAKKAYDINSLLASVEKTRKPISPTPTKDPAETKAPTTGIKGGIEGDNTLPLSISERDLIASKLRQCWNVNAGVEGIDNIVIELNVSLSKDGHVRAVKVVNPQNSAAFRNIAESAERAVYICDTDDKEAPFQMLATKYAARYNAWREMTLRFNPLDSSVF